MVEPERLGDEAALGAREGQPPGERGDHGDDPVGDQRRGADQPAAEDRAVHDQREQHAEHELDRHGDHGQHDGVEDVLPPQAGAQDRDVVVQPDPRLVAREAQVGAQQRQVDGVEDRIGRDREHHDDRRRAQHPAQPALGLRAVGEDLLRLAPAVSREAPIASAPTVRRGRAHSSPLDCSASLMRLVQRAHHGLAVDVRRRRQRRVDRQRDVGVDRGLRAHARPRRAACGRARRTGSS